MSPKNHAEGRRLKLGVGVKKQSQKTTKIAGQCQQNGVQGSLDQNFDLPMFIP